MVYTVADEDFTKMQAVWELPFKGLLNHLSYRMSKMNIKKQ